MALRARAFAAGLGDGGEEDGRAGGWIGNCTI